MNHSPGKCKVCGKYHCLAGCVPIEQCRKDAQKTADEAELTPQDIKCRLKWALDT